MTCRKSNWHTHQPKQIGRHSFLPADHPVSLRLAAVGLAFQKEFFRFEGLAR